MSAIQKRNSLRHCTWVALNNEHAAPEGSARAVALCTVARPCGHPLFAVHTRRPNRADRSEPPEQVAPTPTCSRHLEQLLETGGVAPVATRCPVCGEVNRPRITRVEDLDLPAGSMSFLSADDARRIDEEGGAECRPLVETVRALRSGPAPGGDPGQPAGGLAATRAVEPGGTTALGERPGAMATALVWIDLVLLVAFVAAMTLVAAAVTGHLVG